MLTNSLFLDFLLENGLSTTKTSTRDIICLQFNYGTLSYKEELKKISKIESEEVRTELYARAEKNKDKFKKRTRSEIREEYYRNGVSITYPTFNRKGEIIASETLLYKRLYRTPGKAKKGSCMFIREELYEAALNFLYMGIDLPEENAPIVEIGAYSSLITSTIVGRVQIKPEEILVIPDVDSKHVTDVISIEIDNQKHCKAIPKKDYALKNTLYDGQALIDDSIFPDWGDGYILLRHHFFKAAAFRTYIQKYFQDHFKEDYNTAYVKDYWGNNVKVDKIKLITTENAIKWIKFGVSFDYWSDWIRKNDSQFGIVKTAHESKLGKIRGLQSAQRMSYQMINSLSLENLDYVTKPTVDYVISLRDDLPTFLNYLDRNRNFSNDFEALAFLVRNNPEFVNSQYFKDRRNQIIKNYLLNFKSGKVIQNADNLVIVGSPYAMLLSAVGEDPFTDPTFEIEDIAIQCYTERFEDGEYLAEFRNPFNSRNNLGYLHNHYHEYFTKYFNLGKLIIAVNMIDTSFQDKNNGLTSRASAA